MEEEKQKSDDVEDEEEEEEESEEEEEEEEEEEKEDEEEKSPVKKSTVKSATIPPSDSSTESDSESDADSDKTPPSPNISDFTIKPIISKPQKLEQKKRVSDTELNRNESRNKKMKSSSNAQEDMKSSSNAQEDNGVEEIAKKGSAIQRLWSSDDEIAILKGMADYQTQKGSDPYSEMGAFHEFIKNALRVEVSKNQLMDKIRRMKKKYFTNVEKGENGKDPVFSSPHEFKAFELSKKIWGSSGSGKNTNVVDDSAKNKRKARNSGKSNAANGDSVKNILALPVQEGLLKNEAVWNGKGKSEKNESVGLNYPYLNEAIELGKFTMPGLDKSLVKEGLSLVADSKMKEFEKKWKKLLMDEAELYLKKLNLIHEQTKLVLDAVRASSSMS